MIARAVRLALVRWSLLFLLSSLLLATFGAAAESSSPCMPGKSLTTFQRKIQGLSLHCRNADFPSRILSNVRGGQDAFSQEQGLDRPPVVTNDERATKRIKLKWPLGEGVILTNAVGRTALGFLGGLVLGLILGVTLRGTSPVETSFVGSTLSPSVEVHGRGSIRWRDIIPDTDEWRR